LAESEIQVETSSQADPFERATRAVLFVDMVESVRLIEEAEETTLARWFRLVEHVKQELLPEFEGHLVRSLGDGMLLDFGDVRSAVGVAFAIQRACSRLNVGLAPAQQMFLRMGIEVSDVIVRHDELYGRGVGLAARLMTLAGPSEIVISAHVRDRLTPMLDADVEDLGDCYLRHISQPVRAFRIGPPGPRPAISPAVSLGTLTPSIAVVPFSPRHMASDHGLLGEVLAEEIIRDLSQSSEFSVFSRLTTTAFRGRASVLPDIGAHLNADYVLSGVYSGDYRQVALDAELVEAKSGRVVWSDRLTDRVTAILSGEHELIRQLVAAVSVAVVSRELQRSSLQPLPTLKSYTLLLGAIALMHRLSFGDFERARHMLETLVDRGTRQAVPQAWLANWHVLRVQQGWSVDQDHDAYLALESTKRALDADPSCSLALAIDGFVHTNLLKRLDIAEERYDLAIEANPNDAMAWLLRGTLHAFKGEGEAAVDDTQRALKLTPLHPHRWFYDSLSATACLSAHRYAEALELARRSLRANRTHTSTLRVMAASQWFLGERDEARATAQELMRLEPNLTVSRWLERSPAAGFVTGTEWSQVLRDVGVPN